MDGGNAIYDVYTLHVVLWRSVILDQVSVGLMNAVLKLVEKERNGEITEHNQIRRVADSLVSLDLDNKVSIYQCHFERLFLEMTRAFYQAESKRVIAEKGVIEYMKKVEIRLDEEDKRTQTYLHNSTASPLKRVCLQALIADHFTTLQGQFEVLLDQDREDDLKLMYSLLPRMPDGLDPLVSTFETHMRHLALAAVAEVATDREELEPKLLKIYAQYQGLIETAFYDTPSSWRYYPRQLEW